MPDQQHEELIVPRDPVGQSRRARAGPARASPSARRRSRPPRGRTTDPGYSRMSRGEWTRARRATSRTARRTVRRPTHRSRSRRSVRRPRRDSPRGAHRRASAARRACHAEAAKPRRRVISIPTGGAASTPRTRAAQSARRPTERARDRGVPAPRPWAARSRATRARATRRPPARSVRPSCARCAAGILRSAGDPRTHGPRRRHTASDRPFRAASCRAARPRGSGRAPPAPHETPCV